MPQVRPPSTMPRQPEQKQGCCNVSHNSGQAFFSKKSLYRRSRILHTCPASALAIAARAVGLTRANALGSDSRCRLLLEWGTVGRASEKLSESGLPMGKGSISEWDASAPGGVSISFRVGRDPSNCYQLNIARSDSERITLSAQESPDCALVTPPAHCCVQLPDPAPEGE
jgi:hypothetical protein